MRICPGNVSVVVSEGFRGALHSGLHIGGSFHYQALVSDILRLGGVELIFSTYAMYFFASE